MASITFDSSDDEIPDTPENSNIRGTMTKPNIWNKTNQYAVR